MLRIQVTILVFTLYLKKTTAVPTEVPSTLVRHTREDQLAICFTNLPIDYTSCFWLQGWCPSYLPCPSYSTFPQNVFAIWDYHMLKFCGATFKSTQVVRDKNVTQARIRTLIHKDFGNMAVIFGENPAKLSLFHKNVSAEMRLRRNPQKCPRFYVGSLARNHHASGGRTHSGPRYQVLCKYDGLMYKFSFKKSVCCIASTLLWFALWRLF